jgi:predicted GTPase
MPYGDLRLQEVQRFSSYADFDTHHCTIEEREEYEPLVDQDIVVYAGIDYGKILKAAETEADVIVWDGGNNDTPFYFPDVHIVLFDPHRAGHERLYYPGETNMLMADIAVINKVDTAPPEKVEQVRVNIGRFASKATTVLAESSVLVSQPERISGKRVLVVEDGPTLTHGEMAYGAGWVAARRYGAAEIVDPRPHAVGSIRDTYAKYPTTGTVLPAMGYGDKQVQELAETIRNTSADSVLIATPIDLRRLIDIDKPSTRIRYELQEVGEPTLETVLREFVERPVAV